MFFVSAGNAYFGFGQLLGQSVSTTIVSFAYAALMFVKLVLSEESVAAEL